MPALAFGLSSAKPSTHTQKPSQKRKALFDNDEAASDEDVPSTGRPFGFQPTTTTTTKKPSRQLKPLNPLADADSDNDNLPNHDANPRPTKSPRLTPTTTASTTTTSTTATPPLSNGKHQTPSSKYTSLSSLRNATLHTQSASEVDPTIYDYDTNYSTFSSSAATKAASSKSTSTSAPKYITSLLSSTKQREMDRLRAQEKLLARERAAEGDEFADKEKFVTGGYKRAQEEMRIAEEAEEKARLEEEERRKKGEGGMVEFNKRLLEKGEERMRMVREAEEELRRKRESGEGAGNVDEEVGDGAEGYKDANNPDLNTKNGAKIITNDEGEVVDKRQLLSAGLNVAPPTKKPISKPSSTNLPTSSAPHASTSSTSNPLSAREAQRLRQSRMVERQIEQMEASTRQKEEEEERERAEKNKSRITEEAKMGARERFLARKREREEAAAAGKAK